MNVTTRDAGSLALAPLAALFEASFEGYLIPIRVPPAQLATRVRSEQIDLARSLIMMRDGTPQGLCLLARRGGTARVAAMGLVREARGTGMGRALMDAAIAAARAWGADRLRLEVFERNEAARRLYERAGFQVLRRLAGWERTPRAAESTMALTAMHAGQLARALSAEPEREWPWQLTPESLISTNETLVPYALGTPAQAWAMVDASAPETLSLRMLFVSPEARRHGWGRRMVDALQALHPGRRLYVPPLVPEDFALPVLPNLGFTRTGLDQLEMERRLT
ncbi:GNAT family N-acetyltransferase [Corallococcus sp. H22C18031201]|nr:GNAT family N-acetyltransferase [Corallococcus sp. H22C18031201]